MFRRNVRSKQHVCAPRSPHRLRGAGAFDIDADWRPDFFLGVAVMSSLGWLLRFLRRSRILLALAGIVRFVWGR